MNKASGFTVHDNYSSLTPYSCLAFLHGLKNVERKNGVYNPSKKRFVLCLFNLIVFLLSFHYQQFKYKESKDVSNVYKFCFDLFYMGINVRMILIYIMSIKNGNKELELYKAIDDFDRALKKTDIPYKSIFHKSMLIVVFALLTEAVTEICIFLMSYDEVNIYVLIAHLMPLLIGDLSKCYFYLWTCIIHDRFEMINDGMLVVKRESKYTRAFKFEKHFACLMEKHKRLTGIARLMNEVFQVQLVFHFLINFLVGFANAYYCIYMVAKEREDNAFYWFTVVKFLVFHWFEYFVLIRSSNELCQEARKTHYILCNTDIDVNDDIFHRLTISSIYELNENKLVVTACRLFDIDCSTIFVMFATIANYVFIMLQFEDAQNNQPLKNKTLLYSPTEQNY